MDCQKIIIIGQNQTQIWRNDRPNTINNQLEMGTIKCNHGKVYC